MPMLWTVVGHGAQPAGEFHPAVLKVAQPDGKVARVGALFPPDRLDIAALVAKLGGQGHLALQESVVALLGVVVPDVDVQRGRPGLFDLRDDLVVDIPAAQVRAVVPVAGEHAQESRRRHERLARLPGRASCRPCRRTQTPRGSAAGARRRSSTCPTTRSPGTSRPCVAGPARSPTDDRRRWSACRNAGAAASGAPGRSGRPARPSRQAAGAAGSQAPYRSLGIQPQ